KVRRTRAIGKGKGLGANNQQPINTHTTTSNCMKTKPSFSRRQFVAGAATIASSAAVLHKLQAQITNAIPDQAPDTNTPPPNPAERHGRRFRPHSKTYRDRRHLQI